MELATLVPLLLLAFAFYFLIIRPSRRRTEEARSVANSVQVGSEVMTTAGLFGTVTSVGDDEIELEIAPGVRVRYIKIAIAKVISSDIDLDHPTADAKSDPLDDPLDDAGDDTRG